MPEGRRVELAFRPASGVSPFPLSSGADFSRRGFCFPPFRDLFPSCHSRLWRLGLQPLGSRSTTSSNWLQSLLLPPPLLRSHEARPVLVRVDFPGHRSVELVNRGAIAGRPLHHNFRNRTNKRRQLPAHRVQHRRIERACRRIRSSGARLAHRRPRRCFGAAGRRRKGGQAFAGPPRPPVKYQSTRSGTRPHSESAPREPWPAPSSKSSTVPREWRDRCPRATAAAPADARS